MTQELKAMKDLQDHINGIDELGEHLKDHLCRVLENHIAILELKELKQ